MQFKLELTKNSLDDKRDNLKHLNLFFTQSLIENTLFFEVDIILLEIKEDIDNLQVFVADVGLEPSS